MTESSSEDVDWDEVYRFMREAAARSRGYSTYSEWPLNRKMEELDAATALAAYLTLADRVTWESTELVSADPPDVLLVATGGRRVGVEVTELVCPAAAAYHRHRMKTGEGDPYAYAEWTADLTAQRITELVEQKDQKLAGPRGRYDELIVGIRTDEVTITADIAEEALRSCRPQAQVIDRAFLLLSYHPDTDKTRFPHGRAVFHIELER